MKILYAIQGTGNGHLSRAIEILPHLQQHGQVDVLLSGIQVELDVPFDIKYRLRGLSFIFGKNGGVNLWQTFLKSNIFKLLREIWQLPVKQYDLIVNDFEPVSAWACKLKGARCIGLSNQTALLDSAVPKSKKFDPIGWFILRNYAPTHAQYGFHFLPYSPQIFTPIIRQSIRQLHPTVGQHYLVYLPAHSDKKILSVLKYFPDATWEVFSKKSKTNYTVGNNIKINTISRNGFIQSLAACKGIITAAGFGLTSEALFLNKKLLVVPMQNQIEQSCNAEALSQMGVSVIGDFDSRHRQTIAQWMQKGNVPKVNYPDQTAQLIATLVSSEAMQPQTVKQQFGALKSIFKLNWT